jgi:hypothetical protein
MMNNMHLQRQPKHRPLQQGALLIALQTVEFDISFTFTDKLFLQVHQLIQEFVVDVEMAQVVS